MPSIQLDVPADGAVIDAPLGTSTTLTCSGQFDALIDEHHDARVQVSVDGQVITTAFDVEQRSFQATLTVGSPSAPTLRATLVTRVWVTDSHVPGGGYWKDAGHTVSDPVRLSVLSADPDPLYRITCQCVDVHGRPLQGFRIAAFDQDPRSPDDALGEPGVSDADGLVVFQFRRSSFTEHPGERYPDVYFKVSNAGLDWPCSLPFEHPKGGTLRNFQPRAEPVVIQLPLVGLRVFGWNIDEAAIGPPHDAVAGIWQVEQEIRAKSPDIVILNEINKWVGVFGNLDEVQQLALGLGYFAADTLTAGCVQHDPGHDEWPGFPHGCIGDKYTAVLSRHPVTKVGFITHDPHMTSLHAAIDIHGSVHHVYSTRLDAYHVENQIHGLAQLTESVNQIPDAQPVVHGCDFNSGYARALKPDNSPSNLHVPAHFRAYPRATRLWNTLGGIGWDGGCPDDHLFVRGPYRVVHAERTAPQPNPSGHGWVYAQLVQIAALQGLCLNDGSLLRERSASAIHVVAGGARFEVPDMDALNRLYFSGEAVNVVDDGALAELPLLPCDGTALREEQDLVPWLVGGGLRHAMSPAEVIAYGGWDYIFTLHTGALGQIPIAP
jgi:endonuclease/exonuclease/phosphatase family metal-dependent hydrolase